MTTVLPAPALAPRNVPVLGHALRMIRDPLAFLTSVDVTADLLELRLGPQKAVLCCAPELTRQVLVNARTYDKGGRMFDKIRLSAGDGLVSARWPEHRRDRPQVQPAFHPSRIAHYATVMTEEIDACLQPWRPGDTVDVNAAMHRYALRVLARTMFSAAAALPFLDDIVRCVPIGLRGSYWRTMNPVDFVERLPLPANRRFDAAVARLLEIAAVLVAEYRKSEVDNGDLLAMMLAARDTETGTGMSDQRIVEHVFTMLIAGTETTSSLVSWAAYLLGGHPEVARALGEELDTVADARQSGLLRRVLNETLRLYPPSWLLTRITTVDCRLGRYRLPAGTTVMFSPYLIHRRPDVFAEPGRFDPDRWLPERAAGIPRAAFIPFGGGARKCIGDEFGLAEASVALAAIARRWRLSPVDDRPVRPVPRIALSPGALPMVLNAR